MCRVFEPCSTTMCTMCLRWKTRWFLLQICVVLLATVVPTSTSDDTRCYCNDASCVSTGYMCKSPAGRCFSHLTQDVVSGVRSAHGCAELLPEVTRHACAHNDVTDSTRTSGSGDWPVLICCGADMCNYMDSAAVNVFVHRRMNSTTLNEGRSQSADGSSVQSAVAADTSFHYHDDDTLQRELWFRVAVIAVPVAGALVLIGLVVIAVRLLLKDGGRRRCRHNGRYCRPLLPPPVSQDCCPVCHVAGPHATVVMTTNTDCQSVGHVTRISDPISCAHDVTLCHVTNNNTPTTLPICDKHDRPQTVTGVTFDDVSTSCRHSTLYHKMADEYMPCMAGVHCNGPFSRVDTDDGNRHHVVSTRGHCCCDSKARLKYIFIPSELRASVGAPVYVRNDIIQIDVNSEQTKHNQQIIR